MATSFDLEDIAPASMVELVKELEADEDNPNGLELLNFIKECYMNPDNYHVLATPLLQLRRISIHCDSIISFFGKLEDIHITIKVIDNDGRVSVLVDSDECQNGGISFSYPHLFIDCWISQLNRPQWISKYLLVRLHLEDRANGKMMEDTLRLIWESDVPTDLMCSRELESENFGTISVTYTYFRNATLAFVECNLKKNDDICNSEDEYATMSGDIIASYSHGCYELFHQADDEGDALILDGAKQSWRWCLAVPAFSKLRFAFNLVLNQELDIDGDYLEFHPYHQFLHTDEIVGQKWCLQVTVQWKHVYKLLPRLCECNFADETEWFEGDSNYFSDFENSDSITIGESSGLTIASSQKHQRQRPWRPSVNNMVNIKRLDPLPSLCKLLPNLVEVFSIYVCSEYSTEGKSFLCGKIKCYDFFGEHELFSGNENTPLCQYETISMVEPRRCYTGLDFSIRFDLKDDKGSEISCGYLAWCFSSASLWLDRRTCSVVRGKHGYAVVHYTMMSDAVQARVGVSFSCKDGDKYHVRGSIKVRYTGYRYFTQYDKKFYRSVLFEKVNGDYVTLTNDDYIPLSKSVVAVPSDEALIVIVNLNLVNGDEDEILRKEIKFQAQEEDKYISEKIEGQKNCGFNVTVHWG